MRNSELIHKNNPLLGGLLLDVIPRRFENIQPLDVLNIANCTHNVNMLQAESENV